MKAWNINSNSKFEMSLVLRHLSPPLPKLLTLMQLSWRKAAAYAVALAFFSSEIGVFRGILEVHVMIQAIGVESRCVHLN